MDAALLRERWTLIESGALGVVVVAVEEDLAGIGTGFGRMGTNFNGMPEARGNSSARGAFLTGVVFVSGTAWSTKLSDGEPLRLESGGGKRGAAAACGSDTRQCICLLGVIIGPEKFLEDRIRATVLPLLPSGCVGKDDRVSKSPSSLC